MVSVQNRQVVSSKDNFDIDKILALDKLIFFYFILCLYK